MPPPHKLDDRKVLIKLTHTHVIQTLEEFPDFPRKIDLISMVKNNKITAAQELAYRLWGAAISAVIPRREEARILDRIETLIEDFEWTIERGTRQQATRNEDLHRCH